MVNENRATSPNPGVRRDHIIAVAANLFAEEGYGASSMASIATRLGGSKATLYKYFPSKKKLFEEVMKHLCQRIFVPVDDFCITK